MPGRSPEDDSWESLPDDAWSSADDDWSEERDGTGDRAGGSRGGGGARKGGSRSAHGKPAPGMRKALMVSGILGGAMVLAIALVAVVVFRGGSSSSSSQAAGFTKPTTGTSSSPVAHASASVTASKSPDPKKSAKPSKSPDAKKSASPSKSATHSTANAAPSVLSVPAGYKLTFDPGFSGSSLNTGTWSTCYDWATSATAGCTNNPATEKEWYLPSQVSVSGGVLNLTAKQESTQGQSSSGAAQTYACRSGMVSSKPGFSFTYGLISITAKLPYGPGLWPALWLAATNDQWPPELDIMEHWYSEQDYKIYDHTVGTSYVGGPVPTPVNLSTGFHTYSLLWTKDRVTWYLDGVQKFTTTDHVPQQSMYFIANVADRIPDGTSRTTVASDECNGTMQISSVKVWQP